MHPRTFPCLLLAAVALLTSAAGCDIKTSDRDIVYLEPPIAVDRINAPGRMFERAPKGAYVDPRSAKAYAEGHIPGAIHLPLAEMSTAASEVLAGYNLFIVYDSDYGDVIAKAATKRLVELGYPEVYMLQGGLKAWQKDGYTIVKGPTASGDAAPTTEPKK